MKRQCAQNPMLQEFSLCGDAFDAFASGDADEEHEIAPGGGVVTCPDCCRSVKEIIASKYKLKPRAEQ